MKLVACSAAAAACVIVDSFSASAAKLPPLGSPEAAKLRPIDLHLSVPAGPNPRTLRLDKWQRYVPPHNPRNDAARAAARVPGKAKLPVWSAQIQSFDGKTYQFSMLGKSVLGTGVGTTKIELVVVPLVFKYKNVTFDPAHPFANCSPAAITTMVAQSPLLQNVSYKAGKTKVGNSQLIDLFQRANFWNPYIKTNNPKYHLLFTATQAPGYTINVGSNASGQTCNTGATGALGTVDIDTFDGIVQQQLLPDLVSKGLVNPTKIPLFLSYNVIYGGALGYHFVWQASRKAPVYVYGVSAYLDVAGAAVGGSAPPDIEVLSHEIAEFTDDPFVNNGTPAWGHTGQVQGCQDNLEVGDPLTGQSGATIPMPNGYTYTITDLAYFSWFYRQQPSIAASGWYTLLNFFPGPQNLCQ